jgi:hypothetical protein
MQADVVDNSLATSISSSDGFPSPSFKFSEPSDTEEPTSELASTPLSPEVDPTSMMWSWFDDDAALPEGDGESFSKEIDESGDDVMELNAFVMNIFGVDRPVSLWFVEESGLGQMGKGDIIGDDPRLKLEILLKLVRKSFMGTGTIADTLGIATVITRI